MLADVPVVTSRAPGPGWVLGEGATYFEANESALVAKALQEAANNHGNSNRTSNRQRALDSFSPQAVSRKLQKLAQR